jgi:hypothetical protein
MYMMHLVCLYRCVYVPWIYGFIYACVCVVYAGKKALSNKVDEYNRCFEVVSHYAVHFSHVAFSCKKQGSGRSDCNTPKNVRCVCIFI